MDRTSFLKKLLLIDGGKDAHQRTPWRARFQGGGGAEPAEDPLHLPAAPRREDGTLFPGALHPLRPLPRGLSRAHHRQGGGTPHGVRHAHRESLHPPVHAVRQVHRGLSRFSPPRHRGPAHGPGRVARRDLPLLHRRSVCTKCVEACPLGAKAIESVPTGGISVHVEACTGCGFCVHACPTEPKSLHLEGRPPVPLRGHPRPKVRDAR